MFHHYAQLRAVIIFVHLKLMLFLQTIKYQLGVLVLNCYGMEVVVYSSYLWTSYFIHAF